MTKASALFVTMIFLARCTETIETAKYSVLNVEFRYKSVYDAPFIVIKNYWHVPPSVNLWRHEKQKCDISGSTRHTKSIERAKYPVFDAQFRYKIVHDAPILLLTSNFFTRIVHRLFIWHVPLSVNLWRHDKQCDNPGSTRRANSIETAKYSV